MVLTSQLRWQLLSLLGRNLNKLTVMGGGDI